MSAPLRLAVVGVVVQDQIHGADGTTAHGLGGLAYSVGALASLAGSDIEVVPVCRVAQDTREAVQLEWSRYANVSLGGLIEWPGPGSRVVLTYRAGGEVGGDRDERLRGETPPLDAEELEELERCAAVLVNCITGPVLTEDALRRVGQLAVPIHLDVHSLVLGIDDSGRRFPERPRNWLEWLLAADSVQCNEQEAATLAGESEWNRPTEEFVRGLVESGMGPSLVVVTRGSRGATLYRPQTAALDFPAPRVGVVDPTGAGDTFGAAFVIERLRGRSAEAATRAAVQAASAACELRGTRALNQLATG